ncbi:Tetratricopeptide-like helical [Penicillium tannophilum]|nr:Tetratricopeptide-like helical [Penicillium tannophilum]
MSSKSTLNEWRGKASSTSSSSQLTKAPGPTFQTATGQPPSPRDQTLSSEVSKRVPKPGGHHRRTIRQRLFGRK